MMKFLKHKAVFTCLTGLLFLAIFSASGSAQPLLKSVSVEGNRHYSQRKLVIWSGLKTGSSLTTEKVDGAARKILSSLAEEGYYFCRIDSIGWGWAEDSSRVDLTIYLIEGERLLLGDFEIRGDTLDAESTEYLLTRPGQPVFAGNLQSDFVEILHSKEETGYPFARLDLKSLHLSHDTLNVEARLTSGPLAKIESVHILGLRSTKEKVVSRESRFKAGDIFQPSRLEKARNRINKLPFIESVSQPALVPLGSGRYNLLFQVEETRSNSFDGIIGYQPSAGEEKGEVTGLLDLTFMNLFGTGRKAKLHWERTSQYHQALELFYEEPWVAGLPFSLWGEFRQEIQDTLYLERRVAGGSTWPALDILSLKGSLFQEEVLPDSAAALYKSRTVGGALEMEYDTRDYPDNPTSGFLYRSLVTAAQKKYEEAANQGVLDVRQYEVDANWSYSIWKRQILNLQFHGRYLESDEDPIPQPDLYRLGGTQTLRGYREDQFLGHLIGWSSVEYRFWLDKLSRIYAFFNLGYYQYEPESSSRISGYPWGYGVGFRQGTRLGILGFDFALGEDDVLATAKVHFRLINRF